MRPRVLIALSLGAGAIAHADPPPPPPASAPAPETTRAEFGLPPAPEEQPLDCGDGTAFGCAMATDPLADDVPFALSTWLPASYLLSLPVADATYDQVASFALGAVPTFAGPSLGGATGLENRWTIDGAPAENVRTGIVGTPLPLTFLDGIRVTAGGFAARDRVSTGGTIDARLLRGGDHHVLDVRAWAGWTAKLRQPPRATSTFQLRRGEVQLGPQASASIVASGPLPDVLGGKAWYAAGIAPGVSDADFSWRAAKLVDADGDGVPDGYPGVIATDPIETTRHSVLTWSLPVMARVGLDRGAHHLALSLVGTGGTSAYYLYNATLQAAGVDRTSYAGDAIATWRGEWHDTRARVQLAWHRSGRHESAADPAAADLPQVLSAYIPDTLADDPVLAAACQPSSTASFPPCAIPLGWFASGGAGMLVDETGDRPSVTADLAHRFGGNVVRVGATGEDVRLVTRSRFTGGAQLRTLFPGEQSERRFLDPGRACPDDPAEPCPTIDEQTLRYRTRYTAAYVEDTWHATPSLQVDGGLRWELMWVGTVLHFSDELAPRIGIAWDPLGGGRSRVWASMGRSYALLPAGLGATIIARDRYVDQLSGSFGQGRAITTGAPIAVADGVEPIAQDELTTGAQLALLRRVRVTVWAQGRWLVRGLDTTPRGLDNPGRAGGMPATRDTGMVAAELATAPTDRLVLRVGYMYGRAFGTWDGPFDPREGAALFSGADFDVTSANQDGPLPTDLGHHAYIEAEGHGQVGPVRLGVATRLTLTSGAPRDVLANSNLGLVYLLPRGEGGRLPMTSNANLRLSASWRGFDVTLDLFDVFDKQPATFVDQIYATGAVRPIVGGTRADLVFLRSDLGTPAARSTGFNLPTAFAGPFAAVLGVRRGF